MTEEKVIILKNRVTEVLGIEKPIIQGPMFWLTSGKFVGAISKAGALGVLGFNAGQTETAETLEKSVENMRKEIEIARSITSNPIGMNVSPSPEVEEVSKAMFDLMVETGVEVAVMVGSFDKEWTKRYHENGIKVVFRPHTPSVENVEEAIQGGADVIVATGFDEGGTVPDRVIGTFSIIPLIVDAAKGRVPVIGAGGIADERTAKAAMVLGAEGIYVGSAFLMAEESNMAQNIKEQVKNFDATDMLMYNDYSSYYRSIPGELPNELQEMSDKGATKQEIFDKHYGYKGMRNGMVFGDLSKGYASFGLGISFMNEIEPAAAIVDRLMRGIES
ncbi:NAD(P)H-dependent flavin oxidoreductase [Staphylococcus muscae]|uniref:Probable nitronate monooxygenase n=1 Tax=Staphylococcus muscae TaxID=1294 RepID=A0ABQ1HQW7_9STAP|nr:nitronate monooxygenase [Staphylococcus muscae]GGA86181.1 diguanylate cyclase [Staphylococcus muscae]